MKLEFEVDTNEEIFEGYTGCEALCYYTPASSAMFIRIQ